MENEKDLTVSEEVVEESTDSSDHNWTITERSEESALVRNLLKIYQTPNFEDVQASCYQIQCSH